jgi:hypothetical protein
VPLGVVDPHYFEKDKSKRLEEFVIYQMASIDRRLRIISKEAGVVARITQIVDLKGMPSGGSFVKNVKYSAAVLSFLRVLVLTPQRHFVDILSRTLVINAPSTIMKFWKVVQTFLDKRNVDKTKFLSDIHEVGQQRCILY